MGAAPTIPRLVDAPSPSQVDPSARGFLESLGGPALLRIAGTDPQRHRGVSVLLHGNEPSGLLALHRFLREGVQPHATLICCIGAVRAALEPPLFSHRMLAADRDLNRCFGASVDGWEGQFATAALAAFRETGCETLIDLHNNSGHNPAYGVLTTKDPRRLALVRLFATRAIYTELRLGSLIEVTEDDFVGVSIECGRSGDPQADALAFEGLSAYAQAADLYPSDHGEVVLYEDPLRVCLSPGASVAFADQPVAGVDLTLRADLDKHNFECLPAGLILGWAAMDRPWPLRVESTDAHDHTSDLFETRDGVVRLRTAMTPIMMTTDPRVARQDCICYFVRGR